MMRFCRLLVAFVFVSSLYAQETSNSPTALPEALTKRVDSLAMAWVENPDRPVPMLLKAPVLRCNDPTRAEMDGAIWLWLDGKRPVTAMCLLQYASGKSNYEFVSLTNDALKVTGRPDWSWEPDATPREWKKLADAVPKKPVARQLALQAMAKRFTATETYRGQLHGLRLLDRPIYTYADEDRSILDGAIFVLANGTNPEILLQLEARQDQTDAYYVAFARLSGAALNVVLDDMEIWSADTIVAKDPSKPYFAVNELPGTE